MPRTARSRYVIAAALWIAAPCLLTLGVAGRPVYLLVLCMAVTATVCAAVVERDERAQQLIRLSWWAGTTVAPPAPKFPRQGSVPSWPGTDRVVAEARRPTI